MAEEMISISKTDWEQMNQQNAALRQQNAALRQQIAALEHEIATLKSTVQTLVQKRMDEYTAYLTQSCHTRARTS